MYKCSICGAKYEYKRMRDTHEATCGLEKLSEFMDVPDPEINTISRDDTASSGRKTSQKSLNNWR